MGTRHYLVLHFKCTSIHMQLHTPAASYLLAHHKFCTCYDNLGKCRPIFDLSIDVFCVCSSYVKQWKHLHTWSICAACKQG